MNRRVGQLAVIVVGILAISPVWADIPTGAFDLPPVTAAIKPEKHASRSPKPLSRKPSKSAKTSRRLAPQKAAKHSQQPRIAAVKQPEHKKAAVAMPPVSPGKTVVASTSSAYSHYLPKLKQCVEHAWRTVKEQGMVVQSTMRKTWQRVKRWMDS